MWPVSINWRFVELPPSHSKLCFSTLPFLFLFTSSPFLLSSIEGRETGEAAAMAVSLRWLLLLVLGLLVVVAGGFGWIGGESFFVSRNGEGIGRRRLREGPPPANETFPR